MSRTPLRPDPRLSRFVLVALALIVPAIGASLAVQTEVPDPFEAAARVLESRCLQCHGPVKRKGGLLLATREGILTGGDSGPAAVPGDTARSEFLAAVSYQDPDFEMPPTGRISNAEIAALEAWVTAGLPWPEGRTLEAPPEEESAAAKIPTDRWCYEPLTRPEVPDVRGVDWVTSPIDAFILARLEQEGLAPAPLADRATLCRRLTYDLTGLPPTPEEVSSFVADDRPDSYTRRVDRLLESPQYGVQWGRHWLDLVRFAETDSYERDNLKTGAWRYRDWVIGAFNADLPYDRFLTEQLAGDELEDARLPQIIATGYHRLGIWDDEPTDTLQAVYDDLDGILDTTCRVTMAASMGCARCHDHKGDPIPTVDYYRMLAFFEGLKPYKVGGGNALTPQNFLRDVPADLGSDDFENEVRAYRIERQELIETMRNLVSELLERWGIEAHVNARAPLLRGLVRHLSFDRPEDPGLETEGTELVGGSRYSIALRIHGGESGGIIDRPVADDFTISLWFRTEHEGAGGNRDLRWFRGTGLVDGEVPGIVADFGLSLVGSHLCAGVGEPETFIHGPPGVTDGEWHHAAFTRHKESGKIELFLDGARVAEGTGGRQSLTAAGKLRIGRMLPGRDSLDGDVDDIRFHDRVLEPREILELALDGGALPTYTAGIRERIGAPEAARHEQAVARLSTLAPPTRTMIEVLSAQESGVEIEPSFVRVRGNAGTKGAEVRAGFPGFLGGGDAEIAPATHAGTSGRRLALARWLTDPEHPLTARVMANRIWQYHFGRGIVRTSNDFGRFGELPTHRELLDWLASEFIAGGSSMKQLHRVIVHSSAYRMSSAATEQGLARDPVNDLFWRFDPRRLSAEELRDSVLAVNGTLNLELGGPGVYPPMPEEVLATSSRPDEAWGESSPEDAARRSAFIHVKRSLLHPLLVSFDLADTDSSCPVRFVTIQPTQALTLLNSDFSQSEAARFADRLERERPGDRRAQVARALELVRQRDPSPPMIERQLRFIRELEEQEGLTPRKALETFCLVAINLNEFIHLD